jgi:hypothetical protein
MECRVDDAGLHAVADQRAKDRVAGAAGDADPVAILHAALFGVVRMNLEAILAVPHDVRRAPCLRADVVLREHAAGGEQQWIAARGAFVRGHIGRDVELAFAAHDSPTCIVGVPSGCASLQGHWILPSRSILSKLTPVNVGVRLAISSMICDGCA